MTTLEPAQSENKPPDPDTYDLAELEKDERPLCWCCLQICFQAVQTTHFCVLCNVCTQQCTEKLQHKEQIECPSKKCTDKILTKEDLGTPDHRTRKKIEEMDFYCQHHSEGCEKILKLSEVDEHLGTDCEYQEVSCKFCCSKFPRKDLKEHEEQICELRIVKCDECDIEMTAKTKEGHYDLKNNNCCTEHEFECPFCTTVKEKKSELVEDIHYKECSAKPRYCEFRSTGCSYFDTDEKVNEHEEKFVVFHQKQLLKSLKIQAEQHAEAMKTQKIQHEEVIQKNEMMHKEVLERQDEENKKEAEKRREDFDILMLQKQEIAHKNLLEINEKQHAEVLENLKKNHDEELKAVLEKNEDDFKCLSEKRELDHKELIAIQESQHKEYVDTLKTQHDQDKKIQREEFEKMLQSIKAENQERIETLELQHTEAMKNKLEEFEEKMKTRETEHAEFLKLKTEENTAIINEATSQMSDSISSALQQLQVTDSKLTLEREATRSQFEVVSQTFLQFKQFYDLNLENLGKQILQLKKEKDSEVSSLMHFSEDLNEKTRDLEDKCAEVKEHSIGVEEQVMLDTLKFWCGFVVRNHRGQHYWLIEDIKNKVSTRNNHFRSPVLTTNRGYKFKVQLWCKYTTVQLMLLLCPSETDELQWPCTTEFQLEFVDPSSPSSLSPASASVHYSTASPNCKPKFELPPKRDVVLNFCDNYVHLAKVDLLKKFTKEGNLLVRVFAIDSD